MGESDSSELPEPFIERPKPGPTAVRTPTPAPATQSDQDEMDLDAQYEPGDELPPVLSEKSASRSEEHTSELQSRPHLVCRLLLEKKKIQKKQYELPAQQSEPKYQEYVLIARDAIFTSNKHVNYNG